MLLMLLLSLTVQPRVDLVWNDPYALYPAAGRAAMSFEIESLFERNGFDVRVHVARKDSPVGVGTSLSAVPQVNVIVSPGNARGFGLDERTMAAAVGERGAGFTIFVFLAAVRSTLGHNPSAHQVGPRRLRELSRAVGRVVAHELVHVLAPERGHARSGLMTRTLTRKVLLDRTIELDAASRRMALDRLQRLASSS